MSSERKVMREDDPYIMYSTTCEVCLSSFKVGQVVVETKEGQIKHKECKK